MSKDKKMTLKQAMQINNRAFRLLYSKFPQMMLSRLLYVVWTNITPYVGIYFSALIVNELCGDRNPERLKILVLITLGVAAVISLVTALLNKWQTGQSAGIWYKSENIFSEKLMSMDFADVENAKNTQLLSVIRQNQNGGGWGLNRVISNYEDLVGSVFTVLGGISLSVSLFVLSVPQDSAYAFLNSPWFVLVLIAVMALITFLSPALSNKAESYWAKHADDHVLANRIFGFWGWLGYDKDIACDIRMYRQDRLCEKHNTNKYDVFCSKGFFARLTVSKIGPLQAASAAVSVIFTGVVYLFVCLKAWAGAFGLGSVAQYVSSITKLSSGVSKFFYTVGTMRNNAQFLKLVFDFLDIPNKMQQGDLPLPENIGENCEVEFKNVSFKYPGTDVYVLRNVNMKINFGKRLAVVGVNGSGKTTFIKLLCRMYDPTEGEILLNGVDIRKYQYSQYLKFFSVVFQDFKIFAFTLGENVGSSANYDAARATECLDKAGFGDRLATMEKGLDTFLYSAYDKNGVNVSGGEAQKIAIARTLYKNAPFIVLDEPTATLDPLAEAEIYSKFNDIAQGKTAVYISHRLSSCKFCDEIAVFSDGEVVQYGTHESLLAEKNGKYFKLWNAQAQYYTD